MKVLLIDDHPLILSALQSVIQGLGNHVSVVGVGTAREAREILKRDANFDMVLLDLQLGDADGFEVLAEFRAAYPALPVVVVSASDRHSDVIRAVDLGAMGFVPKRSSNETLFEALRMVMSGGIFVPHMAMGSGGPVGTSDGSPADVLALLLQGQPNKLIARELGLSVETVKDHVAAVLRALNVSSRTQAVLAVSQMSHQPGGFTAWRKSH